MKANEFVKTFGWDEAKKILNARRTWVDKKSGRELTDNSFVLKTRTYEYAIGTLYRGNFTKYGKNSYRCGELNLLLLDRLVKSHKLVERYGGLEEANRIICDAYKGSIYEIPKGHEELSLAIQDVESCM